MTDGRDPTPADDDALLADLFDALLQDVLDGKSIDPAQLLPDRDNLSSMIDVSDGLASDLRHILKESGGRGARLFKGEIPIHPDAVAAGGKDPLERALTDGEDFELCFTAPAAEAARLVREQPFGTPCPVKIIGTVIEKPLFQWDDDSEIAWRGFVHDFA